MARVKGGEWSAYALAMLRIIAGFTFYCHGAQKVLGAFGGHKVAIFSLIGLAGVLELVGGFLILLGLFTRPVAFVLCGEMAVAYFKAHFSRSAWPILNGGELAVLYCFIFLYLFTAGSGAVSVDRFIRKKS